MVVMYRVKTEFTGLPGMPGLNQLYFSAATGTASAASDAAGDFWGAVDAQMSSLLQWNVLTDVEAVDSATGQIVGVSQGTNRSGVGDLSGDFLPTATQGLVRLRTGVYVNGREVRGKIFIPGLTEGAATAGQMGSAVEATLQTAVNSLMSVANTELLVFSRANLRAEPVVSASVWNQFAVLRSRRD